MDQNPERHELVTAVEKPTPTIEQEEANHPGFRFIRDFAENGMDDGSVAPIIRNTLLRFWKVDIDAFGTHCMSGQERRYCVFAKTPEDGHAKYLGGKAMRGAVVPLPYAPPRING